MGFLKNLFSGLKSPSFRATVEGSPQLAPVIAPMKQCNIQPALQLFSTSPDAELRYRLVEAAAHLFGTEMARTQLLDAWVNNTPDDPFARLVRAKWRLESLPSWKPNDPADVADRARAAHEEAGTWATQEYQRIAEAAPSDAVPWAMMLDLAMANDLAGKQRLYAEVERRQPLFFPAQLAMHHALSAMWYGDHQQSIGFVRSVSQRAPAGSDLHALVTFGHYRVYAYILHVGEGEAAAKQYIANPDVRADAQQALERSLWSPQYRPGHWSLFARHSAACWFKQLGDEARCKAELEKCGEFYDENKAPWNLSIARYAELRKSVGL